MSASLPSQAATSQSSPSSASSWSRWWSSWRLADVITTRWYNRRPVDTLPIRMGHRKKFIFFPGFGFVMWFALFILTLFSINYNNNLGIACVCFLGVLYTVSIFQNYYLALGPLELTGATSHAVEQGRPGGLSLHFKYNKPMVKDHPLCWVEIGSASFPILFNADSRALVVIPFSSSSPGVFNYPRLRVSTRWPHSITKTWVELKLPGRVVIVPSVPPGMEDGSSHVKQEKTISPAASLHGDIEGIRAVHPMETVSKIAWKPTWRHGKTMTYTWETPKSTCAIIRWPNTQQSPEDKIRSMRGQIDAAVTSHQSFQIVHPQYASHIGSGTAFGVMALGVLMAREWPISAWPKTEVA